MSSGVAQSQGGTRDDDLDAALPASAGGSATRVPPTAGQWQWARRIFLANLVAELGILITGGLVRVTGSGLGCPTWPQCVPGSFTPVVQQAQGYHKYIEFGNRLLTFVLGALAVAALVIAVLIGTRYVAQRRRVITLGAVPLIGVLAQIVLGGISVRMGLTPATVAGHFLLSIVIIAASTWIVLTLTPDVVQHGRAATKPVRPEIRWLAVTLAVLAVIILALGTVVTGSGPHAGDAAAPRFSLDPRAMSWLHADFVLVFVGLSVALVVALRLVDADPVAVRRAQWLLVVTLSQGLVGYVQYATGLPALVVVLHMLGAGLLTVAVTGVLEALFRPAAPATLAEVDVR